MGGPLRGTAFGVPEGRQRCRFEVPTSPQFLPYGATLGSMLSFDAEVVISPGLLGVVTHTGAAVVRR